MEERPRIRMDCKPHLFVSHYDYISVVSPPFPPPSCDSLTCWGSSPCDTNMFVLHVARKTITAATTPLHHSTESERGE